MRHDCELRRIERAHPVDRGRLLDEEALRSLQRIAGPEELSRLIRLGIDAYDGYCDRMGAQGAGWEEVYREAHKLKGSSGTLAMRAICVGAAQIEQACDRRHPLNDLVERLRGTIAATRAALVARGLIPGTH